jgi:hypothetical protein
MQVPRPFCSAAVQPVRPKARMQLLLLTCKVATELSTSITFLRCIRHFIDSWIGLDPQQVVQFDDADRELGRGHR